MIGQLPPPGGPVSNGPKPGVQRQGGASFEEWVADLAPHAGNRNGTPAGNAAGNDFGDPPGHAPSVQVELLVRDAHGNTELVAMPWQLAASGHLAQESASYRQVLGVAGHVSAGTREPTMGAGGSQSNPRPVAATPAVSHAAALLTTMAVSPVRTSVATGPETEVNTRTAAATAAAVPLAVRLMRWMEQHGHDPSLWIRDYRLDEAGARAIADAMRQLTRDQGLQLERIVVNAREVWRAPASTTGKENSACP